MLNCRVDLETKKISQAYIYNTLASPVFHSTNLGFGTVTYWDTLVTSRLQKSLYKMITHNNLAKWIGKYSNPSIDLNTTNIHWSSYKVARIESPYSIKDFITK